MLTQSKKYNIISTCTLYGDGVKWKKNIARFDIQIWK